MKYNIECAYCGSEFESKRNDALYCSDSCRTMNSRDKRQKVQPNAEYKLNYVGEEDQTISNKAKLVGMETEEYIKFISLNSVHDYSELLLEKRTLEDLNKKLKAKLSFFTGSLEKGIFLDIDYEMHGQIYQEMDRYEKNFNTPEEYIIYVSSNMNKIIKNTMKETVVATIKEMRKK